MLSIIEKWKEKSREEVKGEESYGVFLRRKLVRGIQGYREEIM